MTVVERTDTVERLRAICESTWTPTKSFLLAEMEVAATEIEGLRELVSELFGCIAIHGLEGVPLDPDPHNTLAAYCIDGTAAHTAAITLDRLWATQGVAS